MLCSTSTFPHTNIYGKLLLTKILQATSSAPSVYTPRCTSKHHNQPTAARPSSPRALRMLAFAHPIAARTTMREVLAQFPRGFRPAEFIRPRSSCSSSATQDLLSESLRLRFYDLRLPTPGSPQALRGCGSYPTPSQHDLPHCAAVANTRPIVAGRVKVFYHLCGRRNVSRLVLCPTLPILVCQSTDGSLVPQF
jgi:hypothetical protein